MKRIIKFAEELIPAVLDGRKTATTRDEIKANPGDTFCVRGHGFIVDSVTTLPVSIACSRFYDKEGYETPSDMMEDLLRFYSDLKTNATVYVHTFMSLEMVERIQCPTANIFKITTAGKVRK